MLSIGLHQASAALVRNVGSTALHTVGAVSLPCMAARVSQCLAVSVRPFSICQVIFTLLFSAQKGFLA